MLLRVPFDAGHLEDKERIIEKLNLNAIDIHLRLSEFISEADMEKIMAYFSGKSRSLYLLSI